MVENPMRFDARCQKMGMDNFHGDKSSTCRLSILSMKSTKLKIHQVLLGPYIARLAWQNLQPGHCPTVTVLALIIQFQIQDTSTALGVMFMVDCFLQVVIRNDSIFKRLGVLRISIWSHRPTW